MGWICPECKENITYVGFNSYDMRTGEYNGDEWWTDPEYSTHHFTFFCPECGGFLVDVDVESRDEAIKMLERIIGEWKE